MESGSRVVFRYSNTHEKTLPYGSFRRRMETHSAPPASSHRIRTTQDPRSSRDPRRRLLPPENRMPVAALAPQLPQVAHRLLVLPQMAHRRYLGEDQPCSPRTLAGPPQTGSPAQRGCSGLPVGEEHRGGRRRERLRRGQEGQGAQAPLPGGHRRFRAQSQGPQCEFVGSGGDQGAAATGGPAVPPPVAPVAGRGLPRRGQGRRLGTEDPGLECGPRGAPQKPVPEAVLMRRAAEWAKEGVAVDWRKLLPPKGYVVLPRRWVVEQTISWIDQQRRMSKDYERLCASGEALVYAAMIRLMTRRLACL